MRRNIATTPSAPNADTFVRPFVQLTRVSKRIELAAASTAEKLENIVCNLT